jgi:hypothetical protein
MTFFVRTAIAVVLLINVVHTLTGAASGTPVKLRMR